MNAARVWILRVACLAALALGAYLLYDSYQDLTWGRRAISEAGASAYSPGRIQDEILAESSEKNRSGAASENAGLLLIAAGLIMDGLAAVIGKLQKASSLIPDKR